MKKEITSMIENIEEILNKEYAYNDWHQGRHSALRGVKQRLEIILNEEIKRERTKVANGN